MWHSMIRGCLLLEEELILDGVHCSIEEAMIDEESDSSPAAEVGVYAIDRYQEQ